MNPITVKDLIERMVVCWNEKDADRFAALFRQDAVFIDVVGNAMVGPEEIARGHAMPWSTILKEAVLTADAITVRAITPDVSAVEVRWTTTGHRTPTGEQLPPRHGVMLVVVTGERDGDQDGPGIVQVCNADHTATYRRGDAGPGGPTH